MIWPSGLSARHEQEDHVVENLLHRRRVVGREPVDELQRHLRGADLGCVDAAGDEHDDLARAGRSRRARRARRAALEVQLPLELLVAVEVLQRVGRADFERDERVAAGGLAELAVAHAVRCAGRELHVFDDLVPANELVVGADLEPDKLFGRLKRAGRRQPGGQQQREPDAQRRHECRDSAARSRSAGTTPGASTGMSKNRPAVRVQDNMNEALGSATRMDAVQAPIVPVIGELHSADAGHHFARPGRRPLRAAARSRSRPRAPRSPEPETARVSGRRRPAGARSIASRRSWRPRTASTSRAAAASW